MDPNLTWIMIYLLPLPSAVSVPPLSENGDHYKRDIHPPPPPNVSTTESHMWLPQRLDCSTLILLFLSLCVLPPPLLPHFFRLFIHSTPGQAHIISRHCGCVSRSCPYLSHLHTSTGSGILIQPFVTIPSSAAGCLLPDCCSPCVVLLSPFPPLKPDPFCCHRADRSCLVSMSDARRSVSSGHFEAAS